MSEKTNSESYDLRLNIPPHFCVIGIESGRPLVGGGECRKTPLKYAPTIGALSVQTSSLERATFARKRNLSNLSGTRIIVRARMFEYAYLQREKADPGISFRCCTIMCALLDLHMIPPIYCSISARGPRENAKFNEIHNIRRPRAKKNVKGVGDPYTVNFVERLTIYQRVLAGTAYGRKLSARGRKIETCLIVVKAIFEMLEAS